MMTGARLLSAVGIMSAAFAVTALNAHRPPDTLALRLATIPSEIAGWQNAGEDRIDSSVLANLAPTDYIARQYTNQQARMGVFVAFYGAQHGTEGIHSPQNCLPSSGWSIESRGRVTVSVAGRDQDINRCVIRKAADRLLLFYWYQSRDRIVANEYAGKLLLVRDAILRRPRGAVIARIVLPQGTVLEPDATAFARDLASSIDSCFPH